MICKNLSTYFDFYRNIYQIKHKNNNKKQQKKINKEMSKFKESKKEKQERLEAEKKKIDQIFRQFDTDGSGEIDKDEFIAGMKHYFCLDNMGPEGDELNCIFEVIFKFCDKSSFFHKRNGQLDKKEFEKIVLAFPKRQITTQNIAEILGETLFNIIDDNGNGYISRREMRSFCHKVNKKDDDPIEMFKGVTFKEIDYNHDKNINKQEFSFWFWSQLMNPVDKK